MKLHIMLRRLSVFWILPASWRQQNPTTFASQKMKKEQELPLKQKGQNEWTQLSRIVLSVGPLLALIEHFLA